MPRRLPRSFLLAAALLTSSTAALADGPPPSEPAPARAAAAPPSSHASVLAALQAPEPAPRKMSASYYAVLGITEVFVGLLYVGTEAKGAQVAGTVLSLAVPIVHAAHGSPGRGFASLGLRVGLAWSGYMLAGGDGNNCHNAPFCTDNAGAIGFAAGYAAAAIIDYAFLSPDRPRKPKRWWAPTAAAAPSGASIGVVGGF